MKTKKLLCLLICMLLITAGTAHADEPHITATAEYITADTIVISGSVQGDVGDRISLVFGDINTMLHVDEVDIVNGEFSFILSLSDKVPVHEYTYTLSARSVQFKGTLQTTGTPYDYGKMRSVVEADIDFTVSNYVPTFSGTASCVPGKKVNINIFNKTTGITVINDQIDCFDGKYNFSYTLPKLSYSYEYDISFSVTDREKKLVRTALNVKTSYLLIAFKGPIIANNGCDLSIRVQSMNTDLLDKSMSIRSYEWNTDFQIPNILANCKYKITARIDQDVFGTTNGSVNYLANSKLYNALKELRPQLDSSGTGIITSDELAAITGILDLSKRELQSIEGLQNCTGITHLYINDNIINNISPVLTLTNLRYLDASNNKLNSVYRIPPYLKYLDLSGNNIQDIGALSFSDTIVQLDVSDNRIADVRPLRDYGFLRYLDIKNNNITDITALPKKRYAKLIITGNNITNR